MATGQQSRGLFGGAITSDIASEWIDASDLRQIPDNQEVLLSKANNLTLIIEVLQNVAEGAAKDDLESAIRFHFDSLAHDNDAASSEVQQIFALPGTSPTDSLQSTADGTPAPLLLVGEQRVKKFGQGSGAGDRVRIYLALWRLSPAKNVDLVLSLNQPVEAGDVSDAEQSASIAGSASANALEVFQRAASSLVIRDWKLFAN